MEAVAVPSRRVDTIFDELEAIERQVATRAYELFERRGCRMGHALDDWLAAEQDETWTPAVDLRERDDAYVVKAAVAGVEPDQLDVRVTPDDLLIEADIHHEHAEKERVLACEFAHGKLFKRIHYPQHVDPDKVEATLKNGLLTVTAPITRAARPVEVKEG